MGCLREESRELGLLPCSDRGSRDRPVKWSSCPSSETELNSVLFKDGLDTGLEGVYVKGTET